MRKSATLILLQNSTVVKAPRGSVGCFLISTPPPLGYLHLQVFRHVRATVEEEYRQGESRGAITERTVEGDVMKSAGHESLNRAQEVKETGGREHSEVFLELQGSLLAVLMAGLVHDYLQCLVDIIQYQHAIIYFLVFSTCWF